MSKKDDWKFTEEEVYRYSANKMAEFVSPDPKSDHFFRTIHERGLFHWSPRGIPWGELFEGLAELERRVEAQQKAEEPQ